MSPLIDLLTKRQAIEPGTHDVIIDGYIHDAPTGWDACRECSKKFTPRGEE